MPEYWSPYHGGLYRADLEVDTGLDRAAIQSIAEKLTAYPGKLPHPSEDQEAPRATRCDGPRQACRSTTAWRKPSLSDRCCSTARPSASADRTRSAAPSTSATPCSSISRTSSSWIPLNHLDPNQAPSASTTRSSLKRACWALNTATAAITPKRWCCGKRSSATSPTALRSSSTSSSPPPKTSGDCSAASPCCCRMAMRARAPSTPARASSAICSWPRIDNIQICQPSTAAQYFHLLRRQALRTVAQAAGGLHAEEHAAASRRAVADRGLVASALSCR